MALEIRRIGNGRDLRAFHALPQILHRGHRGWVPPLLMDELRSFDPRHNPAYRYCDVALWLAVSGETVVGRIAGIVNRRYNEMTGEHTARFSHLECIEERAVAEALLATVEDWARANRLCRVIGPFGFTDQDPEGFLVDGFAEETSVATYHNFPYVVEFLNQLGWDKFVDYVVYRIPVPAATPPLYERILRRVEKQGELEVMEFTQRSQLKHLVRPVLELMNETFEGLAGYAPLDSREMDDLAKRWLPVLDPRFVKIVKHGTELVGFVIAIPCMNEGLRRAHGRLLPLGWLWILREARKAKRLDLLLGGIKNAYRGRGVDALLGTAMMRSARAAGFTTFDSHNELEHNTRVQAEMARMGGQVYKRYRVFQKQLDT